MSKSLFEGIARCQDLLDEAKSLGTDKKIESLPRTFTKLSELAGMYPSLNLAVEMCCESYSAMKEEFLKKHEDLKDDEETFTDVAHETGCIGYKANMPKLSGADNIRDFIACVAHGMATGIIPGPEGTRLLYAAQVAHSALPSPMRRKKCRKTSQMHTQTPQSTQDPSTT